MPSGHPILRLPAVHISQLTPPWALGTGTTSFAGVETHGCCACDTPDPTIIWSPGDQCTTCGRLIDPTKHT